MGDDSSLLVELKKINHKDSKGTKGKKHKKYLTPVHCVH